jgi:hypothetical protein
MNMKKIIPGIDTINSKYTYNHVSNFHQTILTILGNKDLARLSVSDLKKIAYFIQLIIQLLELPHNTYQTQEKIKHPYVKLKGIGAMRRSKKCLCALLKWIEQLISQKYLTLETLLDNYYKHFPYAQQIYTPGLILTQPYDLTRKQPSV